MKVYIESMGCDSSISDSNQLRQCLLNNNILLTNNYKEATHIVLFSCGFNTLILSSNLERLKKLSTNTEAKLILAGCIPKIKPSSIFLADYFVEPKEIHKFNDIFDLKINIENFSPKFEREDRQIIRISTGCCGKCSYCAIKLATGYVKSRTIEEIKKDLLDGMKNGIKTFIFTSEDNGSWGQDVGKDIRDLLKEISDMPEEFRVLITTFHPSWFIRYPDLYNHLKSPKIEKNIYLSL